MGQPELKSFIVELLIVGRRGPTIRQTLFVTPANVLFVLAEFYSERNLCKLVLVGHENEGISYVAIAARLLF